MLTTFRPRRRAEQRRKFLSRALPSPAAPGRPGRHRPRTPASRPLIRAAWGCGLVLAAAPTALAHFIWIAPPSEFGVAAEPVDDGRQRVQIHFSEDAYPDNPELLDRLDDLQVWRLTPDRDPQPVRPEREGDALVIRLGEEPGPAIEDSLFVGSQTFGVRERAGSRFLLRYYAKGGPRGDADVWQQVDTSRRLELDLKHRLDAGQVHLQSRFRAEPAGEAAVRVAGPKGQSWELTADDQGRATFTPETAGRYSIWVRHIEAAEGKHEGEAHDSVRHYVTLTLDLPQTALAAPEEPPVVAHEHLTPLPMSLTSFGGAVLGDHVYVYGGNMGASHRYSTQDQNNALYRLPLRGDGVWEKVIQGPHLQGLAMEPHDGKLIRIGGFTAMNAPGEDHHLVSQDAVAMIDPDAATPTWVALPSLPEPRSSFDSAVLGDTLYVIGGWAMAGEDDRQWHETAWAMDLSAPSPQWKAIADPPTIRRANAVAAHGGKIYSIGGITDFGDTTLTTEVYDPDSDQWSAGPDLVGEEPIAGFGASAFAVGGDLYISTVAGTLQRLSDDGRRWDVVGQTPTQRFFHRMLPIADGHFVVVGGSNREGRVREVEVYAVPGR